MSVTRPTENDAPMDDRGSKMSSGIVNSFARAVMTTVGAVLLTIVPVLPVSADEVNKVGVSKRAIAEKIEYCKTCHGLSGQGFRGASTMPRLAGQTSDYIEGQLAAFIERRRTNPYMFNVVRALSPQMRSALADHFSKLKARPLSGAPKELVAEGRKIFEGGIPDAEIPPCASCHGEQAKGDSVFPRLAGQLNDYIVAKLQNWEKERGLDPKNPDFSVTMLPMVRGLNKSQVQAVAAYLSELDP
jgi:cytochrome c553